MTTVTPGLPYILSRSKAYARGRTTSSAMTTVTPGLPYILSRSKTYARGRTTS